MSNCKYLIITLFFITNIFGQSLINGYGIGFKNNTYDAATQSLSSSGLIPSFGNDIGLQNPSTWHNLNYTYFSGTYRSNHIEVENIADFGNSMFESIQFIIPIKIKYSVGLGLAPYLNQYIELVGAEKVEFIAFDDTVDTYSSFGSFGGISELSFSIGGIVANYLNAALKFGFLYGSNRKEDIFTLDELDYYSQDRYVYSGSVAEIFVNSDLLTMFNFPIKLYASFGFPISSISAEVAYYQPFEDSNDSGFQDSGDFPSSSNASDPIEEKINKILSPYEYQFGIDYQLNGGFSLLGELSYWMDKEEISKNLSRLDDQIKSVFRINVGLAKFGSSIIKRPIDRFNFKLGAYSQEIDFIEAKSIKEYGVSTGLSYNFGITKNQIDFAYSYGKRQNLVGIGDEVIQKFSIGITVGDIWFVKRRSR